MHEASQSRRGTGSALDARCLIGKPVHIPDVQADPNTSCTEASESVGRLSDDSGVPMLRERTPIGVTASVAIRGAAIYR